MSSKEQNGYEISKAKYRIAGIDTGLILRKGGIIEAQARDYLCDFPGDPKIVVGLPDEYIAQKRAAVPHMSDFEVEYMWSGAEFCTRLLEFDGFMLHASGVVYEDRAYLFSAPSGTGKSTHTTIWRKTFGEENTYIINDDKPVIRMIDGKVMVFGTPWSGKTDQNKNKAVPLQGICFLERAAENRIEVMPTREALHKILDQTIRPTDVEHMSILLDLLDRLLKNIKVYKLYCNMENQAAIVAYNGMNNERGGCCED